MKLSLFAPTVLTTLLLASAASATKHNFHSDLSPDQENVAPDLGEPPKAPSGVGDFTYDDVTKQLCGKISWTGTTSAVTGIHVHQAPDGDPTGDGTVKVLVPVGPATTSPVTFNFTLDATWDLKILGKDPMEVYANIHTTNNTKGEMRTHAPWDTGVTEVPCPAPTNPDGGLPGTTIPDASTPTPVPTTTATTPPASSSTGTSGGTSGTAGDGTGNLAPSEPTAAPAKKGCNATGSPTGALSFALFVGLGIFAISSRYRRKSK